MQFFRGFVIGTLNLVAFIVFIGAIAYSAFAGYNGAYAEYLAISPALSWATDPWISAAIGAVIGWLGASVALGILFVLIDIQDGIRDLHRDLTAQS